MRANLLCNLNIKCTFSTRLPTSFPGFSPTSPTERERETLGKNPGNEVTRRSKIRPTLNSIRQTDVDTLMIRTQSRVRVRVIYLNQTSIHH